MMTATPLLRGFIDQATRLWVGALSIILSVAFVVAGTTIASSVRTGLVQAQLDRPLSTTGVLSAEQGRVPPAAAEIGLPATGRGATVLAANGSAPLAGKRAVLLADPHFVDVERGSLPVADGEVAVDDRTARILDADVGEEVYLQAADGSAEPWLLTAVVSARTGDQKGRDTIAVTGDGMQALFGSGYDEVLLFGDPSEHADALARLGLGSDNGLVLRGVSTEMAQDAAAAAGSLSIIGSLLSALTLVTAVAGTFVIGNTFAVAAAGRRREAALLRLVGASRRQIRNQFLAEALLLGLAASVLGVVVGGAAGWLVSTLMGTPVTPSPTLVVGGLLVGLVVTAVGLWAPVRRIGRVGPIEALGAAERTELEAPTKARWLLVIPGIVLGAMVLQIPILGAVLGGLIAFMVLVAIGPLLMPRLGRLVMSGPWRRGPVAAMARANVVRYPRRSARSVTAVLMGVALAASTTALVTAMGNLDDLYDAGDVLVYAPTVDGQLISELEALPSVSGVGKLSNSELVVWASAGPKEFSTEAAQVLAERPGSHVGDAAEAIADSRAVLGVLSLALGSVAGMSLLVGLVGVGNTVRLTTRERAREFAVLRAVGMTRRQLASMVVVESAGLTGVGALLGLLLGTATIYGMLGVGSLLLIPLISWWLIALIVAGLVMAGAAMAVLPAVAAAQIEPARAVAAAG